MALDHANANTNASGRSIFRGNGGMVRRKRKRNASPAPAAAEQIAVPVTTTTTKTTRNRRKVAMRKSSFYSDYSFDF